MATTTLANVRLLSGGYEITSDHNQLSMTRTKDAPENTTFGAGSRTFHADGLRTMTYGLQGFFESDGTDAIDDMNTTQFDAATSEVLTFVAPPGTIDATAYSFESIHSSFAPFGGTVGDMDTFQIDGTGTGDSFRGLLLEPGTTARSTSSNSSGAQTVAITATETGRSALHVIATTGSPTIDVTIESDDNGDFSSASTRITFVQATAIGAQFLTTSGTVADDYWRAEWTFGGTGSITFAVTFGIA